MSKTSAPPLLREVRHLIGAGRDDLSDGQLLDRFTHHRDEAAFEHLVRRYGRLVHAVCRQVLADPHAAEDAFQATFLVLVHRAPSLDRSRPVADYLYTVAFRLALRARANAARRRVKETEALRNRTDADTPDEELRTAVHEELNQLPDRHRLPLVLSYLEGQTYEQVARAIGCPVGTVGWRLSQARELLRDRLAGRGLAVPAAGVVAALAAAAGQAAVPAHVLHTTVRAALWFAADQGAAAGVASAHAVELAKGALGTMTTKKLTAAAGLLLAVGLCGGTVLVAANGDAPKPAAAGRPADPPRAARPADELPPGATARLGTSRFRHGDAIFFIAYTPDGKHLVTAGKDLAVRLWDRATGEEVRSFERAARKELDPAPVAADKAGKMMMRAGKAALSDQFPIALAPDGRHLAAARGGVVTVWEVATGKTVHDLTAPTPLLDLVYTADGKSLAGVGADQAVTFWDAAAGKLARTVKTKPAGDGDTLIGTAGAVSPDGRHFVQQLIEPGTGNGTLRVVNLDTGAEAGEIKLGAGGAQGVTFSPDGKLLACSGFIDGVIVWDLAAAKEVRRFGGRDKVKSGPRLFGGSIGIAADGKTLALTMDNEAVELWDLTTGEPVKAVGGHERERGGKAVRIILGGLGGLVRRDLALTPDGKSVAVSFGNASVRQFDAGAGAEVPGANGHATAVVAAGTDGRHVITVSFESVRVWDAATGREVRSWRLVVPAYAAAVSPDGKLVATSGGGGTVRFWNPATGEKVRDLDTKREGIAGLSFSPDGKLLATKAGLNSAVNLWTVATGAHVRTVGQDGESAFLGGKVTVDTSGVRSPAIAFSGDGRLMAAAGDQKQLCVWDVGTGALVRELPAIGGKGAFGFAFSADGHSLAVLAAGGSVTVFEVATGEARCELTPAREGAGDAGLPVSRTTVMNLNTLTLGNATGGGVAVTPDGRFVLAAAGGSAVRVWSLPTGQEVARLDGHRGNVSNLRMTADGRHLISGSVDTTALVWDLARLDRIEVARMEPLSAAERDALWEELAKPDSQAAYAAARKLLTDPAAVVGLVKDRVRPVPAVDGTTIERLVADLGGTFNVRRKAAAELERLGELAVPQLRAALAGNPPLELRQRVEQLLTKTTVQKPQGDRLRELRAVEVLELAGTAEARRVLDGLAKGAPGARLTRDATAAAGRMSRQAAN